MISERAWRRDPVEAVADPGTSNPRQAIESPAITVSRFRRCRAAVQDWAHVIAGRFSDAAVEFEQVLQQFVASLHSATSRADVETALLRAVRDLAPMAQIELASVSGQAGSERPGSGSGEKPGSCWTRPAGQSLLDVPLESNGIVRGRLRIYSKARQHSPLTARTRQRLLVLSTLAACLLEKFHRPSEWPWENDPAAVAEDPSLGDSSCNRSRTAKDFAPAPMLRDATFLNAVLPFVLSQAQRHREPLSLLWIEIDRIAGIHELLGRPAVDMLIRHVGEAVATLLRSSDIVARLDDDRIVAILPRATSNDGLFVAERIRREVAAKSRNAAFAPSVTLSIGVATFPTCAHNVSSLFNAADEALSQARSQGRDQVQLAPQRSTTHPGPHLLARNHELKEA